MLVCSMVISSPLLFRSKECLSNWRQQTEGMKVQLQVGAAKGKKGKRRSEREDNSKSTG